MKFSIRDLLLVTVIIALVLGWWIDRSTVASRAREAAKNAESYQALSESLTRQLQDKNPAASIEISVNGQGVVTSTGYTVEVTKPNSSAPAPKLPKED
jgi:hypothetical protein